MSMNCKWSAEFISHSVKPDGCTTGRATAAGPALSVQR